MDIQTIAENYERDGVVRVAHLLSREEVAQVKTELARYLRDKLSSLPPGDRVFESDGQTVRNLWRIQEHDDFFARLARRPDVLELVAPLLHGEPVLITVETFNKPARTGSGVPPHQDNAYFCQTPPDVLTVWIAIDAATIENGPIYYHKGSQHELLPHAASGVDGNSYGLSDPPPVVSEDELVGTLEPGDALIHHGQIVHRSAPNTTDFARCGLLLVYRGAHTQTDAVRQEEYNRAQKGLSP